MKKFGYDTQALNELILKDPHRYAWLGDFRKFQEEPAKYYIEAYPMYYPSGGVDDLYGPWDSLEEAHANVEKYRTRFDFVAIVTVTDNIVGGAGDNDQAGD